MSKCRLNIAQRRSLGLVGCNVLYRYKQRTHFSEIIKSTMGALRQIDPILAPKQPGDKRRRRSAVFDMEASGVIAYLLKLRDERKGEPFVATHSTNDKR